MWPRRNQWESELLGKNFQLYSNYDYDLPSWLEDISTWVLHRKFKGKESLLIDWLIDWYVFKYARLNNQRLWQQETERENTGPLSSLEKTYYTSTWEDKMISEFKLSLTAYWPYPHRIPSPPKNYCFNNLSVIAKGTELTRMFCRQMRNLMQQSIEINAHLIFMNLFSALIWTDVFSMLNDGNRQSCENLKPRSWCQIRRIFLSCKTKRFRKNCKAMCNRKCRKLKNFYWAFHHVIVHFSPLCARRDM